MRKPAARLRCMVRQSERGLRLLQVRVAVGALNDAAPDLARAYLATHTALEAAQAENAALRAGEKELSDSYLRIRAKLQAWDTKPGGVDRFEVTEAALDTALADLTAARAQIEALRGGTIPG
ncbi:MAG: hypothetical protein HC888_01540 [Candidatus Competibacteraceae bacterium]|nr:hypothetical protein [Candidatus Competibacteraceae bacterium]